MCGRDRCEGPARRLRAVPDGDARDAARRRGGGRLRAALVGADPRGMGARDAAAARGRGGGGAGARSRCCARAWPDAEVAVDAELVARLSLPDPDDRHVLAAAIAGGAEVLLTLNRADFPDPDAGAARRAAARAGRVSDRARRRGARPRRGRGGGAGAGRAGLGAAAAAAGAAEAGRAAAARQGAGGRWPPAAPAV